MYEFSVPQDEQLSEVLGVQPDIGDEVGVRHIRLASHDGFTLSLTTDALARSVTICVGTRAEDQLIRIEREGAVEMMVSSESPEVVILFRTGDTGGRIEIGLKSGLSISESSLLL